MTEVYLQQLTINNYLFNTLFTSAREFASETVVPNAQVVAVEPNVGVHVTVCVSITVGLIARNVAVIAPPVDTEYADTSVIVVGAADKPSDVQLSAVKPVGIAPPAFCAVSATASLIGPTESATLDSLARVM